MKRIITVFLVFLFLSCSSDEKILKIESETDFIALIKREGLQKIDKNNSDLLTSTEIINSKYEYKNFGTIYENDRFKLIGILCLKQSKKFHHFLVRTISKGDSKIRGSFLISSYDEKNKVFCGGYVDKNLILNRTCEDFTLKRQIDSEGKIY